MKAQYIKDGRLEGGAIWIDWERQSLLCEYPRSKALAIGTALELWKSLTQSLVAAGQAGALDCGIKELIK